VKSKLIRCTLGFFTICAGCPTARGSGWCDYATRLPNGYQLVRTNVSTIAIFAPDTIDCYLAYNGRVPVPPKITALNVQGHRVFGKTVDSARADPGIKGPTGFFILDTKNHKVQVGLDKDTWLDSLKVYGIKKEPSLRKPGRFFMIRIQLLRSLKWMILGVGVVFSMLIWHKFHKRHRLPKQVCEA